MVNNVVGVSLHLHKILGEPQLTFCVNTSSLQKTWVLSCWILLRQNLQRLFIGRRNFKTAAKNVGRQNLRNQMESGSRIKTACRLFHQNPQNKPVSREKTSLQTFLTNDLVQFLVPTICGSFCKPWRESPVLDKILLSHERQIFLSTSLDENCTEFEFQSNWSYYVNLRQTYFAVKLKCVTGHG